jgi:lambda family phage portal protein
VNLVEIQRQAAQSQTALDRVIAWFSPQRGTDRLRARMQLATVTGEGGYKGGRKDRRATRYWRPKQSSADADLLPDLPDLRARARDLARNTPIATGAIATGVTNVVGDGLQLQAQIDHEALGITEDQADRFEREQEREWALFCRTADFSRVQSFDELQSLVYRATQESGDVVIVRRFRKDVGDIYGTKLQVLEADRISNPNWKSDTETMAGGVEINGDGVPVRLHFSDKHPGGIRVGALNWNSVPFRSADGVPIVLHLYDRLRPEQTRGIPYLAPVIEHLKQLGDYSDAEVSAAVVSAMFTVFVTSKADESQQPIIGETEATAPNEGLQSNERKLSPAAIIGLGEGDDVKFANPMRPNAQFDPFVQAFLRQIGVALELPFELLIKHFTASYSASRAALEMAWQFFRKRRSWLAWRFNQVVYEWMMEEAVAAGRLNRPGFFEDPILRAAYLGSEWNGWARPSLNPKMEAEADEVDLRNCVTTREEICMRRTGGEFEKKIAQLRKEEVLRQAAGLVPVASPQRGQAESNQEVAGDDTDDDTESAPQPQRGYSS